MTTTGPSTPTHPLREMLTIALPTVATMTSYTLMTFTDKLLVSRIGPEPIYVGAQGNGGLAAWVPVSVAQGTLMIINTYVAQNLGAGKPERGPAYAWNGLWIALAYWLVILVPCALLLPRILGLADMDPAQLPLAVQYGRTLLFGGFFTLATRAIGQFFYGMHKAWIVLAAGVAANLFNLGISYALIFGAFGFPKLGVLGSAVGTVLATMLELAIPMAIFLGRRMNAAYSTRRAWRFSMPHARDLIRLGWPGGVMFGNEMICWGFFMVYLVSHFGAQHATAGWIAHQYMSLSFMPAVGISVACTALVGKYQGMKRPDLAAARARLGFAVAFCYMGACGLAFVLLREPMVRLFIPDGAEPDAVATITRLGSGMLIACACFQLFDAGAMVAAGSLRGAGDTVYPGIVTVLCSWTIIVLGGVGITRAFPGLESLGAWIAAAAYIAALCILLLARFISGRWKTIDLLAKSAGAAGH